MRIAGAILMSLFLLIGTYYYATFADSVRRTPVQLAPKLDSGDWRIELFRTFDCIPDPDAGNDALMVQLKGETIYKRADRVPDSESIVIRDVQDIEQGINEIFVSANLHSIDEFDFPDDQYQALRVVVYRGQNQVKDRSFWALSSDLSIAATVEFEAPVADERGDNHQDHRP